MPDFIPLKPIPKQPTIGITSPATTPDPLKLEQGVRYLEKIGCRVEVGSTCSMKEDYLSGSDADRANELMDMVENPRIDAVFCSRGGFGSMRLLRMLDYSLFRDARKLIVGFSDITALEWAIFAQTGIPSVSGMMPAVDFCDSLLPEKEEAQFWELIHTGHLSLTLDTPFELEEPVSFQGPLFPGTLSVADKLLGTDYFPETAGGILCFEDVGERKHKIEGYLEHFSLSGVFQKANGILLGAFTEAETEEYKDLPDMETLLHRVFHSIPTSVIQGVPYGHIKQKLTLPLGVPISVSSAETLSLRTLNSLYEH